MVNAVEVLSLSHIGLLSIRPVASELFNVTMHILPCLDNELAFKKNQHIIA
jgi:hypothetical protein